MPLPVILIDSTTGSDTAASGAGPSIALSGTTNANTDATGLIVTLPAGTVLTGVSTAGDHVIFLNDSTAGSRNFGKITATAGSGGATPTATVADAFGLSLAGKSWAIGGRRATLAGTNSIKLITNNSAAGDAMPGWTIELQSGHTETIAASLVFRRTGDKTNGPITLRGAIGASTIPILTFSNNGSAIASASSITSINIGDATAGPNLELRNSNATKTASVGVAPSGGLWTIEGLIITASGANRFWAGITLTNQLGTIDRCQIGNCAGIGVTLASAIRSVMRGCRVFNNAGAGVNLPANGSFEVRKNLIYGNGGDGINFGASTNTSSTTISDNTIYGNSGDGVEIAGTTSTAGMNVLMISNNQIVANTGYGLNFSGASMSMVGLSGCSPVIDFNNNYSNGSGQCNLSGWIDQNGPNADPGFVNAGSGDFRISSSQQTLGFDTANLPGAGYRSNADIGAWQHAGGTGVAQMSRVFTGQ